MTLELQPIGVIHTPFKEIKNMPFQPAGGAHEPVKSKGDSGQEFRYAPFPSVMAALCRLK